MKIKKTITNEEIKEQLDEIQREQSDSRYKQGRILSAVRNLLSQNNSNGVNDYLIDSINNAR